MVFPAWSQDSTSSHIYAYIDTITMEGNRKTRAAYLLRELNFAPGDSVLIDELPALLELNRQRLLNTALFVQVDVTTPVWLPDRRIQVHIKVVEAWYLYPIPIFSLADRNFNVWWHEFKRDLERVNYGMSWTHTNVSGRADPLRVTIQFGYANLYEITYRRPVINRRQTLGFTAGISYSRTREVAYNTVENKLLFRVNPEAWLLERRSAHAGLIWRPKLLVTHTFLGEYRDNRTDDTVATRLNPAFFLHARNRQRHTSLVYNFTADYRDIRPYPLSGWLAVLELRLNGLLPGDNFRLCRLSAEYGRFFKLKSRLSLETTLRGRLSIPRRQPPYFNNQALGYGGNFVRGYEYYVMDGLDLALLKKSLRFEVFNRRFNFGRLSPVEAFRVMPLKVYLTVNSDLGYANDPYYYKSNPLSNRALWGYGLGLDIVAYNDKVARFEWSWNDLGRAGFYLSIDTGL